jgi:CRISPR/Cas system CSM-associated protein Csm2 small subunit
LRNKSEASQFKARAEDAEYQLAGIQMENAQRLLAVGMPIAQIAEVLNLSIEELRDLE